MNLIHTTHVPAGDGPFPTIFALHGWGASAHDLLGLAPALPDGFLVICPQGTVSVPIGPGMAGYGWFPLTQGQPPDPRAFLKASGQLRTFFAGALPRYPIDERRIVVLGFSQGGLMGYDLVLRDPERFAGLVVLSSWLPEVLAANLPQVDAHRDFPVLVIHGSEDPLVEVARARESREVIGRFGVDLTYQEFPMGHEIRPQALQLILRWLRDRALGPR